MAAPPAQEHACTNNHAAFKYLLNMQPVVSACRSSSRCLHGMQGDQTPYSRCMQHAATVLQGRTHLSASVLQRGPRVQQPSPSHTQAARQGAQEPVCACVHQLTCVEVTICECDLMIILSTVRSLLCHVPKSAEEMPRVRVHHDMY